jgi:hypothetical protein
MLLNLASTWITQQRYTILLYLVSANTFQKQSMMAYTTGDQYHVMISQTCHPDNYTLTVSPADHPDFLYGYFDADWASDSKHRKSITGITLIYAGGSIAYRTKFQDIIAYSSTVAKLSAACDAGIMILDFHSILEDLGIEQPQATVLYEGNNGALLMVNAQQPACRTRHMDIKKFAILNWVEQDLLVLHSISTNNNAADNLTKSLGKQLFC